MLKHPTLDNVSIHLVGAGGTGGFTFTNLVRLLAGTDTPIHVYDGDIVEPKNLKRQQFGQNDVGKNKAEALIQTASETILDAPPIEAHPEYISDADSFLADVLINSDDRTPLIISAVDNVATRKLINEVLKDLPSYVAIDSGNNNQGGQVVWTSSALVTDKKNPFDNGILTQLANMFEVYPHLNNIEDNNPGIVRSCDEVVESEPQAMMANSRNGDIIANIVMSLMNDKELVGNVYESNLEDFTTKVRTIPA